MTTPEIAKAYYNDKADHWKREKTRHRFIYEQLKICGLGPGRTVLDLGCGVGHTSLYMAKAGCTVTAVDFAEELIAWAKANNANKNLKYIADDVTTLDLGEQFDIIVLADVLEHIYVPDVPKFLDVIEKHSYPTTVVYVNVPYGPFIQFVAENNVSELQPIDNAYTVATVLNLFETIGYWPVNIDIYGITTPIEQVSIVFGNRIDMWRAWEEIFGEILEQLNADVPNGSGSEEPSAGEE